MKAILIPFAAFVVFTATSVWAGSNAEPVTKPSVTVEPIVAPAEVKIEPIVCAPTAQKACETKEISLETKETPTSEVKLELTPNQPAEIIVPDKPKQS